MQKISLSLLNRVNSKQLLLTVMVWSALVSSGLLFLPNSIQEVLNLTGLIASNLHLIGLCLIVSYAFIATKIASYFLDEGIRFLQNRRIDEVIEKKVKLLDPTERALLREFFLQGETILTLPQEEPAVDSLTKSNILQLMGNKKHYAIHGPTAEYKISMKARSYLNRQVLRLPNGAPSREDMQNLIKARPRFTLNLATPRKHAA